MIFVAPITAFALTLWAVGAVLKRLILDLPNDRSSHTVPTPRGAGLGIVPALLLVWALFADYRPWPLLIGALVLMAGSWIDDKRGLPPLTRLLLQALMVGLFIASLPLDSWAFAFILGFLLLWFVNLYNFMDGIDGITGIETASLGLGVALVSWFSDGAQSLIVPSLAVVGAALGFLIWNWHPAKVFLGDCGSVPLGLLTGGLLVALALAGQWQAAIILPAYYLADASLTLGRRLLGGEKIWQAHRKHFYQRATRGGAGPAKVSLAVLAGNCVLIASALTAAGGNAPLGMASAAIVVVALLGLLGYWGRNAPP